MPNGAESRQATRCQMRPGGMHCVLWCRIISPHGICILIRMEVPHTQVEYTGRQIAITPSLRRLAEARLDRVGKVAGRSCSAHVIRTEEKYRHTAEPTGQTKLQTI